MIPTNVNTMDCLVGFRYLAGRSAFSAVDVVDTLIVLLMWEEVLPNYQIEGEGQNGLKLGLAHCAVLCNGCLERAQGKGHNELMAL